MIWRMMNTKTKLSRRPIIAHGAWDQFVAMLCTNRRRGSQTLWTGRMNRREPRFKSQLHGSVQHVRTVARQDPERWLLVPCYEDIRSSCKNTALHTACSWVEMLIFWGLRDTQSIESSMFVYYEETLSHDNLSMLTFKTNSFTYSAMTCADQSMRNSFRYRSWDGSVQGELSQTMRELVILSFVSYAASSHAQVSPMRIWRI